MNSKYLGLVNNSTTTPYSPRFMRGVQQSQDIPGSRGQAAGSRGFEVNCQQYLVNKFTIKALTNRLAISLTAMLLLFVCTYNLSYGYTNKNSHISTDGNTINATYSASWSTGALGSRTTHTKKHTYDIIGGGNGNRIIGAMPPYFGSHSLAYGCVSVDEPDEKSRDFYLCLKVTTGGCYYAIFDKYTEKDSEQPGCNSGGVGDFWHYCYLNPYKRTGTDTRLGQGNYMTDPFWLPTSNYQNNLATVDSNLDRMVKNCNFNPKETLQTMVKSFSRVLGIPIDDSYTTVQNGLFFNYNFKDDKYFPTDLRPYDLKLHKRVRCMNLDNLSDLQKVNNSDDRLKIASCAVVNATSDLVLRDVQVNDPNHKSHGEPQSYLIVDFYARRHYDIQGKSDDSGYVPFFYLSSDNKALVSRAYSDEFYAWYNPKLSDSTQNNFIARTNLLHSFKTYDVKKSTGSGYPVLDYIYNFENGNVAEVFNEKLGEPYDGDIKMGGTGDELTWSGDYWYISYYYLLETAKSNIANQKFFIPETTSEDTTPNYIENIEGSIKNQLAKAVFSTDENVQTYLTVAYNKIKNICGCPNDDAKKKNFACRLDNNSVATCHSYCDIYGCDQRSGMYCKLPPISERKFKNGAHYVAECRLYNTPTEVYTSSVTIDVDAVVKLNTLSVKVYYKGILDKSNTDSCVDNNSFIFDVTKNQEKIQPTDANFNYYNNGYRYDIKPSLDKKINSWQSEGFTKVYEHIGKDRYDRPALTGDIGEPLNEVSISENPSIDTLLTEEQVKDFKSNFMLPNTDALCSISKQDYEFVIDTDGKLNSFQSKSFDQLTAGDAPVENNQILIGTVYFGADDPNNSTGTDTFTIHAHYFEVVNNKPYMVNWSKVFKQPEVSLEDLKIVQSNAVTSLDYQKLIFGLANKYKIDFLKGLIEDAKENLANTIRGPVLYDPNMPGFAGCNLGKDISPDSFNLYGGFYISQCNKEPGACSIGRGCLSDSKLSGLNIGQHCILQSDKNYGCGSYCNDGEGCGPDKNCSVCTIENKFCSSDDVKFGKYQCQSKCSDSIDGCPDGQECKPYEVRYGKYKLDYDEGSDKIQLRDTYAEKAVRFSDYGIGCRVINKGHIDNSSLNCIYYDTKGGNEDCKGSDEFSYIDDQKFSVDLGYNFPDRFVKTKTGSYTLYKNKPIDMTLVNAPSDLNASSIQPSKKEICQDFFTNDFMRRPLLLTKDNYHQFNNRYICKCDIEKEQLARDNYCGNFGDLLKDIGKYVDEIYPDHFSMDFMFNIFSNLNSKNSLDLPNLSDDEKKAININNVCDNLDDKDYYLSYMCGKVAELENAIDNYRVKFQQDIDNETFCITKQDKITFREQFINKTDVLINNLTNVIRRELVKIKQGLQHSIDGAYLHHEYNYYIYDFNTNFQPYHCSTVDMGIGN